jgi:hypothetical protein
VSSFTPPDLQTLISTVSTNAAANTVNAGIGLVPAPGAGRRIRLWAVRLALNGSTAAVPASVYARAVVRLGAKVPAVLAVAEDGAPADQQTFPGGLAGADNAALTYDNNATAVTVPIAVVAYYTEEDV